jgi:2-(1,2-epoxy-1,2-dihydrophenyl)acetyl-CoA isomerase
MTGHSLVETIKFEAGADGIGWLLLNRPERMNGMTNRMLRETFDCLTEVAGRRDIRVLVLTGEGRGFCPGADLKHFAAGEVDDPASIEALNVPLLLHTMPQITIAGINGACAGAGFGWAAACDLRFAAQSATFNSAFLNVASAGDMAGPWTLPRLIGAAKARELYFLPAKFFAEDALRMGLVSEVYPTEGFRDTLAATAARLADASPYALRMMKQNFLDAETLPLDSYIELESRRHVDVMARDDAKEAFRAFVEKRPPRFADAGD